MSELGWIIAGGLFAGLVWLFADHWLQDNAWRVEDDAPDGQPLDVGAVKRGREAR